MVSDFIEPVGGFLSLTEEEQSENPNVPADAQKMHEFSKENGYWDCDKFADNVETALTIFETKYPGTCLLFAMCIVFL